jgi:thioester reductase-like protein
LRAKDIEGASVQMKRVLEAMKKRFLLPDSRQPFEKLQFLPASLEEENLGCREKSYEELRNNVSTIIHVSYSTVIGEVSELTNSA